MKSRLVMTATLVVLVLLVTAGPALADNPEPFWDGVVYDAPDPCNPSETTTFTVDWLVTIHEHKNNTVIQVKTWEQTDSGFIVEGKGPQTYVTTTNTANGSWNIIVPNPETGAKYATRGSFNIDLSTGEMRVDRAETYCIKTG